MQARSSIDKPDLFSILFNFNLNTMHGIDVESRLGIDVSVDTLAPQKGDISPRIISVTQESSLPTSSS